MWKFILFIVLAVGAVWQFGLLEMTNQTTNTVEKKVEKKSEDTKVKVVEKRVETPKSTNSLNVSSLKDAFKDMKEPKTTTKVEPKKVVEVKKVKETPKKSESSTIKVASLKNSFKDLKAEPKKETKKSGTVKVSSIKGSLTGLEKVEKKKVETKPKKVEKKDISTFVKSTKKSDDYEDMLLADTEDLEDSKASNAKNVKSDVNLGVAMPKEEKKTAYEKALMSEAIDDTPVEKKAVIVTKIEPKKEEVAVPTLSGSNFREKLKNLLSSAKKAIDKDVDKDLLKAEGDTKSTNRVSVKAKSAKDLLESLVLNANKSKSKSENIYVANLLNEVSKNKIAVLEVKEGYTTIMVKQGDTLSGIATKIYGSSSKYTVIYAANKDRLKNPNQLYIGTILKIPKI